MFIEVDDLRRQTGIEKEFAGRNSRLEIEMQGLPLVFRDIVVTGLSQNVGGKIYVKGEVRAKADLTCGLCLNSFSVDVHTPFEEIFYAAEALDASVAEGLGRAFQGDRIDLTDLILESLILALPMKPVCQPDCKGFCPSCGCNLNTEECGCSRQHPDPRLSVLSEYLKQIKD